MSDLKSKLKNIPHKPGVYLFKNAKEQVLYVGKARDLRNRLGQYFQTDSQGRLAGDGRPQIPFLMSEVADFEHIITDNETECLFLENTLIKKYQPRYNIELRDDKNFLFIKIDYATEIAQIKTVRKPDSRNARYFGPYSSAAKVRETLHILRKIFPYCANEKVSNRPCFYYYLHRCPGVCIGKISIEEYKQTIKKIALFLAGNISEIKKEIKQQMQQAAGHKKFERAASLRDQLRSLQIIEERQKVIFAQKVNWDFISIFQTTDKSAVNVFVIRNGLLLDRKNFILENTQNQQEAEIIKAFLQKYYLENSDTPQQIFVQEMPASESAFLQALFAGKDGKGKKVRIEKPLRGKKAQLIKLGIKNAKEFFENWAMQQASELTKTTLALDELQKILSLKKFPLRIECFDISNIQGTNSVASMVVFENAKPKKSNYRKFKIKIDGQPDDFAMMQEALTRRFGHSPKNSAEKKAAANSDKWPVPDLLVIDGGKGQLGIAVKVLRKYNLQIAVIGLAKREEEIFIPGKSQAILLPKSNYALQLLQRLRDEAHRFAITFHRQLRSKQIRRSALDTIPGIGPKKKKILMQKFGSIQKIKQADEEEIAALIGEKAAKKLAEIF
jgi:excinuclease ABC subunit C